MARLLMAAAPALSPMEAAIQAVLKRWLSEPFALPHANCAIDLLDYAETLTGRQYRGRPSRKDAVRIARDPYGLIDIAADAMQALGLVPVTCAAVRGDLAIIAGADHPLTASLCLKQGGDRCAPMMAARGRAGVEIARVEPEFAWRVPCPRQ